MSHELAALLLTCTIQNSLREGKPLFVLLLDAKSAFDRVLRQILVRRLFLDTTQDQRILYWDLRLASRKTFCSWDGNLMGPIHDQRGVEQGGPNSSDHYKIYNNEQLREAQESGLGSSISIFITICRLPENVLHSFAKLKVAGFWKLKYIAQIRDKNITSLRYFKPENLTTPPPSPS